MKCAMICSSVITASATARQAIAAVHYFLQDQVGTTALKALFNAVYCSQSDPSQRPN